MAISSFSHGILFLLALGGLLLLPGFLTLAALFRKPLRFSPVETLLFSFGISTGLLDFLMIALGKTGIRFTPLSIALGLAFLVALLWGSGMLFRRYRTENSPSQEDSSAAPVSHFSKRQGTLFILLLVLTVFIKTVYLADTVIPSSTDMGHHMYWSKLIAETGRLPLYAKQDIVTDASGSYSISAPQPIADFIIGEHLPFAALNLFSNAGFFSAFPVAFLFFVNLLSVLALAWLAFRLAGGLSSPLFSGRLASPQNAALAALFLFGPLWSLASPQAKFVSGGVIGNTFGNLFLPLALLAYYRGFTEKRPAFLALGFFLTFTLAYIHHLSTLMLLFSLVFIAAAYLLFNAERVAAIGLEWLRLFLQPGPILVALFACAFFFGVALPTYIETHAVGTALGSPTKATRTGLSFLQVTFSSGQARVALGSAAFLVLAALVQRKRYAGAFLLGWGFVLFIMTLHPGWLFIDIPSNRIGAYLSFPFGMLAAFALIWFFAACRSDLLPGKSRLPAVLLLAFSVSGFAFATGSGSSDNAGTLLSQSKALPALETFHASSYLAAHVAPEDIVLKDHNYIAADSWMKLFFLRDYFYPLSRGYFKRYEDNPDREQCTLSMISVPNTPRGEKCYNETGINIVVVNPVDDSAQFDKSRDFSLVYSSQGIAVYFRR